MARTDNLAKSGVCNESLERMQKESLGTNKWVSVLLFLMLKFAPGMKV